MDVVDAFIGHISYKVSQNEYFNPIFPSHKSITHLTTFEPIISLFLRKQTSWLPSKNTYHAKFGQNQKWYLYAYIFRLLIEDACIWILTSQYNFFSKNIHLNHSYVALNSKIYAPLGKWTHLFDEPKLLQLVKL